MLAHKSSYARLHYNKKCNKLPSLYLFQMFIIRPPPSVRHPPGRTSQPVSQRIRKYICSADGPMLYTNIVNRNIKLKVALVRGNHIDSLNIGRNCLHYTYTILTFIFLIWNIWCFPNKVEGAYFLFTLSVRIHSIPLLVFGESTSYVVHIRGPYYGAFPWNIKTELMITFVLKVKKKKSEASHK